MQLSSSLSDSPRKSRSVDVRSTPNRRILVVDDNEAIHEDFRKILSSGDQQDDAFQELEAALFGESTTVKRQSFELDSAFQGQQALECVRQALKEGRPYALAFMDVRMPPGWDGLTTTEHILKEDPNIAIVICSAYSDHSWDDIAKALGDTDRVLLLKKPFDTIEVRQIAHALQQRWELARQAALKVEDLEALVSERTRELSAANAKLREEAEVRKRMELELRLAQKLEAVGQLAAGVAHEINTPMQYIGDNIHFLQSAFEDMQTLIERLRSVFVSYPELARHERATEDVRAAEEDADLSFLTKNVATSIERVREGVDHVSNIVRSMKEFSHPGSGEQTATDLNKALNAALTVAKNEYKYVADVETELGDIPLCVCNAGDINQVFLNLLVNAAHAIAAVPAAPGERGTIRVRTEQEDDATILITISDTGCGIPTQIRERVFDPFFTTKDVGKGTGQGLAIARSVVVDRHGGSLTLESEPGKGTSFFVRLPVRGRNDSEHSALQ